MLIVDDEASMRRVLRLALERGGFRVREAASTEAALASLLDDGLPDAVVCDVLMPGGASGVTLYDVIVARAPALRGRVVFLTGAAHEPAVLRPIEERGVPLVSKLDDLALVVDAVRLATLRAAGPPVGGAA